MNATSAIVKTLMKAPRAARTFSKIETSFRIAGEISDPFDFTKNDVRAAIRLPDGKILSLPAFFDGAQTWRVRHTPGAAGKYQVVAITRNGQKLPVQTEPQSWIVDGETQPGFVRVDAKNPRRFALDSGARYYPFGTNAAWTGGDAPDYPVWFSRFKASGQNWSRIWMNHWDGKNLDWGNAGKSVELGQIDLGVARRWDGIVASAQQNGVYFQLVLQHHGQYSSKVNPNWADNPYNAKNGGFLQNPQEFFTDARAKELTKRKLRYSVARFGYSPAILAWELFNEVQFTDAAQAKNWDIVAAWHREMSDFLRSQDVYNHLITTSSDAPPEVFASSDYYQRHAYPANLILDLSQNSFAGAEWAPKPYFVGEYGSDSTQDRPDEWTLHSGLWAGLFSDAAGAAQYWYGDRADKQNWYHHFAAVSGLLKASDFVARDAKTAIAPARVTIETPMRGPLFLSPGGEWGQAQQSEFDFSKAEDVAGFGRLPRYFQGQNHRDLNPKPLVLKLNAPQAGTLQIRISSVAKAGAHLKVTVAGKTTEWEFAARDADDNEAKTFSLPLPYGAQTISVENSGQDWVVLRDISVPGAAMLLDGKAKSAPNFAMGWFYNAANIEVANPVGSSVGTATIAGPRPGTYDVIWWDTLAGRALKIETARADGLGLRLQIPPVSRDIAMWAIAK
ncbi:DUF5060 domain-containing protein [Abditibacterium utsteinense]|nr:DUF5060 domain-containing protein [Abditibacterium utsteinense]